MTFKELADYLKALGQCFPRSRLREMTGLLRRLAGPRPSGRWEVGHSGEEGFATIHIRHFGDAADCRRFYERAAILLPPSGPRPRRPPSPDFPWLHLYWDLRAGLMRSARVFAPGPARGRKPAQVVGFESNGNRVLLNPQPASNSLFSAVSLPRVFRALFEIKDIVTEWEIRPGRPPRGRGCWSLRFEKPVPWPLFVASSMADPLARDSSRMAYLLRDRRVAELAFEGGSLCAFLRS